MGVDITPMEGYKENSVLARRFFTSEISRMATIPTCFLIKRGSIIRSDNVLDFFAALATTLFRLEPTPGSATETKGHPSWPVIYCLKGR